MRSGRRKTSIIVCVAALAASTLAIQGAHAATVSVNVVRQVGGSGHATMYPWGLGTAPDGTILMADYWNFRVGRFSTNGTLIGNVITTASKGTLPQQHLSPYGVATDPRNGDVYIGDVDAGATVDKYTASGQFIRSIGGLGTGNGKFDYPAYVAVNSQGNLYVVDSRQPNVEVFDPQGNFLFAFGTSGAGRLATPRGSRSIPRTASTSPTTGTTASRCSTRPGSSSSASGPPGPLPVSSDPAVTSGGSRSTPRTDGSTSSTPRST